MQLWASLPCSLLNSTMLATFDTARHMGIAFVDHTGIEVADGMMSFVILKPGFTCETNVLLNLSVREGLSNARKARADLVG